MVSSYDIDISSESSLMVYYLYLDYQNVLLEHCTNFCNFFPCTSAEFVRHIMCTKGELTSFGVIRQPMTRLFRIICSIYFKNSMLCSYQNLNYKQCSKANHSGHFSQGLQNRTPPYCITVLVLNIVCSQTFSQT